MPLAMTAQSWPAWRQTPLRLPAATQTRPPHQLPGLSKAGSAHGRRSQGSDGLTGSRAGAWSWSCGGKRHRPLGWCAGGADSPLPRQQRRRELGQLHCLITARPKVSAKTDGRAGLGWRHTATGRPPGSRPNRTAAGTGLGAKALGTRQARHEARWS